MRYGVGCEMERRASEKGGESRPGRSAGDSADGDVERHDHADIPTCAERSTAMPSWRRREQHASCGLNQCRLAPGHCPPVRGGPSSSSVVIRIRDSGTWFGSSRAASSAIRSDGRLRHRPLHLRGRSGRSRLGVGEAGREPPARALADRRGKRRSSRSMVEQSPQLGRLRRHMAGRHVHGRSTRVRPGATRARAGLGPVLCHSRRRPGRKRHHLEHALRCSEVAAQEDGGRRASTPPVLKLASYLRREERELEAGGLS